MNQHQTKGVPKNEKGGQKSDEAPKESQGAKGPPKNDQLLHMEEGSGALRFPCDVSEPLSREWQRCQAQEAAGEKQAVIINRSDNLKSELDKVCQREPGECEELSGFRREMGTALSFVNVNNAFSSGNTLDKSCVVAVVGFSSVSNLTQGPQGWANNLRTPEDAISFARLAMLHEGFHCHENNKAPEKVKVSYGGKELEVNVSEEEQALYRELWADTRTALHIRSYGRGFNPQSSEGAEVNRRLQRVIDAVNGDRERDQGDHRTIKALEVVKGLSTEEIASKNPEELDALARSIAMKVLEQKVSENYNGSWLRRLF